MLKEPLYSILLSSGSLFFLTSCGQENPSFKETGEAYAVSIDSSSTGNGADAVVANPAISSDEVDKILADMEQGILSDDAPWNPKHSLASDGSTNAACNIVADSSSASQSSTASSASSASSGDDDSSKNGNSGNTNGKGKGKGNGKTHLMASAAESCDQRYADKIHDGDDDSDTHARPSIQEDLACGKIIGVDQSQIVHVSGNMNNITIRSTSVLALRITGNQSKVTLDLSKTTGSIPGICVFLAGNQPHIDIDLGVSVGRMLYVARGNQASGSIRMESSGDIKSSFFDLRGNSPSVMISGASDALCAAASVFGDRGLFTCGK